MRARFQIAVIRSCRLAGSSRTAWYRRGTGKDQSVLRMRIREIAHQRPRFGYQRIHVMLRREGWPVNKSVSDGFTGSKGCNYARGYVVVSTCVCIEESFP